MLKICSKCGEAKPRGAFSAHRGTKDRLRPDCKACVAEYNARYRAKHAERLREYDNLRYGGRYAEAKRERARRRYYEYRETDRALRYASTARYRAKLLRATPFWSEREPIAKLYADANMLRRLGVDVHVDHIVPLRAENVCGLHVLANLRIVGAAENIRKGASLTEVPEHPAVAVLDLL